MHDAHSRPPESLRNAFKDWRKRSLEDMQSGPNIIDPYVPDREQIRFLPKSRNFDTDIPQPALSRTEDEKGASRNAFEVLGLPGLHVFPSLISPDLQVELLDKLLHRDLSNPDHKTNLHLHYHVSYPSGEDPSFFAADRELKLHPKDPGVHKPISYAQILETKLRWMTLGGQYDWTNKVYPDEIPPQFPPDLVASLKTLFPNVAPEAAIVNLYSPGDTLSVHRDVSEKSDNALISISLGCDAVFLVGDADGGQVVVIRLRSGDAVLMSGKSRYAWHGVPKILAKTCPAWLSDWPDIPAGVYSPWREWMSNKRINLNVRQMHQEPQSYG